MTTNQAETAEDLNFDISKVGQLDTAEWFDTAEKVSAQSILEKVRELAKPFFSPYVIMRTTVTGKRIIEAFPEIASLVESQAKRIEELEASAEDNASACESAVKKWNELEAENKLLRELLDKSLTKMRIMHEQTGGEYGGGMPLHILTKDIETALASVSL